MTCDCRCRRCINCESATHLNNLKDILLSATVLALIYFAGYTRSISWLFDWLPWRWK
jgi:hypothetical protein